MQTADLISLLRKGAAEWNAWKERQEDAAVRLVQERPPDVELRYVAWGAAMRELIRADLRGADLRGFDLSGAKLGAFGRLLEVLEERGLSSSDLTELESSMINLRNADLSDANLTGTDLHKACLAGANLQNANLRGADLSDAVLDDSQLKDAQLEGAKLTRAKLHRAWLVGSPDYMVQWLVDGSDAGRTTGFFKPHLASAILDGADFTGARLSGLDLRGVPLGTAASFRKAHFTHANLSGISLRNTDLREADLSGADLTGADLTAAQVNRVKRTRNRTLGSLSTFAEDNLKPAILRDACLRRATLEGVDLSWMDLTGVTLTGAKLTRANLAGINFTNQDLEGVDLTGADLSYTMLARTKLNRATLADCRIHGLAAWSVTLDGAIQHNLVITPPDEATITVDDLEIAQFLYLLLDNKKVRNAVDTITSKLVLILGRFTPERKAVLDALRQELPKHDRLPILFDFDKPTSKNLSETVAMLASLSRFIIADLTDPSSIPQELQQIVPHRPSVPVQPIILSSQDPYALFKDLLDYPWVLPPCRYDSLESLVGSLEEKVICPAEGAATKLQARRRAVEEKMKA